MLLASQGIPNRAIARRTGLSRPTVIAKRKGFLAGGLEALRQRQRGKRRQPVLTSQLEQKILGPHSEDPTRGWHPLDSTCARPTTGNFPDDGRAGSGSVMKSSLIVWRSSRSPTIHSSKRKCAMWWGLYLNLPARPDKPPKLGVTFSGGNVDLNALPWLP
jgi:Winged helix-turn helix